MTMDVKTVFLNSNLDESIYMIQPEGLHWNRPRRKSLWTETIYLWNETGFALLENRFDQAIKMYGFDQNIDESYVYKRIQNDKIIFLVLYVDDVWIIGNDIGALSSTKV